MVTGDEGNTNAGLPSGGGAGLTAGALNLDMGLQYQLTDTSLVDPAEATDPRSDFVQVIDDCEASAGKWKSTIVDSQLAGTLANEGQGKKFGGMPHGPNDDTPRQFAGTQSLVVRYDTHTGTADDVEREFNFPLDATLDGKTDTLSVRVFPTQASTSISVELEDDSGTKHKDSAVALSGTYEWEEVTATLSTFSTAGVDTAKIKFIRIFTDKAAVDTIWAIDQLRLTSVSTSGTRQALTGPYSSVVLANNEQTTISISDDVVEPYDGKKSIQIDYVEGVAQLEIDFSATALDVASDEAITIKLMLTGGERTIDIECEGETPYQAETITLQWNDIPCPVSRRSESTRNTLPGNVRRGVPTKKMEIVIETTRLTEISLVRIRIHAADEPVAQTTFLTGMSKAKFDNPTVGPGDMIFESSVINVDAGSDAISWTQSTVLLPGGANFASTGETIPVPIDGTDVSKKVLKLSSDVLTTSYWTATGRSLSGAEKISTSLDLMGIWIYVDQDQLWNVDNPTAELFVAVGVADTIAFAVHPYGDIRIGHGGWHFLVFDLAEAATAGVNTIDAIEIGIKGSSAGHKLDFFIDTIKSGDAIASTDLVTALL